MSARDSLDGCGEEEVCCSTGVRTTNHSTRTESLKDYTVPVSAIYQLLLKFKTAYAGVHNYKECTVQTAYNSQHVPRYSASAHTQ